MKEEEISADIVIIGAGIAGLSLAFRAAQNELKSLVLDDGRNGATYSATGLLAPRLDYMLCDIDLVRLSDLECLRWKILFPKIVSPRQFLIPVNPFCRRKFSCIETLLEKYDESTPFRRKNLPKSSRIPRSVLEKMEPNLKNNHFEGALSFWELTVNPSQLLREFKLLINDPAYYRRIMIEPKSVHFEVRDKKVETVYFRTKHGDKINVSGSKQPLVVINAAGPWIQDVVAPFGINLDIKLYLGAQASASGCLFQNGIITFDQSGKYCVCLPQKDFLQIGPTNTLFTGHPDNVKVPLGDLKQLSATLKSILNPSVEISTFHLLKAGLRIKSNFGETNRPIIWSHHKEGFSNLYTLFPGKMSLGLLAADEMLRVINRDGWRNLNELGISLRCALEGEHVLRNKLFLKAERMRSLAEVGISMIFN